MHGHMNVKPRILTTQFINKLRIILTVSRYSWCKHHYLVGHRHGDKRSR